ARDAIGPISRAKHVRARAASTIGSFWRSSAASSHARRASSRSPRPDGARSKRCTVWRRAGSPSSTTVSTSSASIPRIVRGTGRPVVASARAGGAEVIAEGVNGAVVEPTDARAITSALERFRERPAADLVEAARRSAEPYTYAAQVRGFAEIYGQIARARCDFP